MKPSPMESKPKKKAPLTIREKRLWKLIADNKEAKPLNQLAIMAGYSESYANVGEFYRSVSSGKYADAFIKAGITQELISAKMKELLSAERVTVTSRKRIQQKRMTVDDKGQPVEQILYTYDDIREVQPDYTARAKAIEIVLRTTGEIKDQTNTAIQIVLSDPLERNL
jgi:hypothetical protein